MKPIIMHKICLSFLRIQLFTFLLKIEEKVYNKILVLIYYCVKNCDNISRFLAIYSYIKKKM